MAVLARNDSRHGTVNGYGNHRCRCPKCREAWRIHHQAYVVRVARTGRYGFCEDCGEAFGYARKPGKCQACLRRSRKPEHGTEGRYKSCRCEKCTRAARLARRRRRSRQSGLVVSTGAGRGFV